MFSFHHAAISSRDIERSTSFYSRLGFEQVVEWRSEDGNLTIRHLRLDSFFLEIFCYSACVAAPTAMATLEDDLHQLGVKHIALQVADLDVARRRILDLGLASSVETKRGRTGIDYFFIRDPDGIWVEVVSDRRSLPPTIS